MKRYSIFISIYVFLPFLVLSWWAWVFHFRIPPVSSLVGHPIIAGDLALRTHELLPYLSSFERDFLLKALSGDYKLMIQLIRAWDEDANTLIGMGLQGIQRLTSDGLFQSQLIAHLIETTSSEQLEQFNIQLSHKTLYDDLSHAITPKPKISRFLPQSYVATSMLLAILPYKQIIAIPEGYKTLTELHSPQLLNAFASAETFKGEKLFLSKPDLAFVSHYSHPQTVEMLKNQSIELFTIQQINTLADIQSTILKIGHAAKHPLESQLLVHFMDATLKAIDNRLVAISQNVHDDQSFNRLMYICYHHHNLIPTKNSLTGQLLHRILTYHPKLNCPIPEADYEWRISCEQENLLNYSPDCIVLALPGGKIGFKRWLDEHPVLRDLNAYKHNRIFILDESLQEFPSHHISLAYFDLYQAIAAAYCL